MKQQTASPCLQRPASLSGSQLDTSLWTRSLNSIATLLAVAGLGGVAHAATPVGTLSTIHAFENSSGYPPAETDEGRSPFGSLTKGDDGAFYGTTGANWAQPNAMPSGEVDVAFKVTVAGEYSVLAHFGGSSGNGANPCNKLFKGSDGNFYGTTTLGGENDKGSVFKMTPSGTVTVMASFTSYASSGRYPTSGVIIANDGNFYGVAKPHYPDFGETEVIFKMTPEGTLSKLASFPSDQPDARIFRNLVQGPDGSLYGASYYGGSSNKGSIFKVTLSGTFTTLVSFDGSNGQGADGLMLASDGNFYGVTEGNQDRLPSGGVDVDHLGTVFKMTPSGTLTTIFEFKNASYGAFPFGPLVQGDDGMLYGTTKRDGYYDTGSVYRISTSGTTFTELGHMPSNGQQMKWPSGGVVLATPNLLLGTTAMGGLFIDGESVTLRDQGTIFSLDITSLNGPEMAVEVPAGTNLISGSSTVSYGTVANGVAAPKTFTIKNWGTSALSVSSVTVSGGNASDFSVNTTGMSSSIAAGGQTTFTVSLTASALGSRSTTLTIANDDADEGTFTLTLTGNSSATQPEIAVEAPSGTNLTSGTSTVSYGSVSTGVDTDKTFVVKNPGTGVLIISSVSVAGTNAADYTVNTTGMSTTVAAGGQTTFTVSLKAAGTGARTATLTINSNDSDESAFTLALTGTGTVSQGIEFTTSLIDKAQKDTSVTLTITRGNTAATQTVTIATENGTASTFPPVAGAIAGTDYVALTGAATTVSLPAGTKTKNVVITLKARIGTVPNRQFKVVLSDASAGSTLGVKSTATVRILADDTKAPTITLTSPNITTLNGAVDNTVVTVAGYGSDENGISRISLTHNAGATRDLGFTNDVAPARITFSTPVSLFIGSNIIDVRAYDMKGNIAYATKITITVTGGQTFTAIRSVPSTYSTKADTVGLLTLKANPAERAQALAPTTVNALTRTALVLPGTPLTVTAAPKTGFAFSHWTGLPSGATVVGNVAQFTMPAPPNPMPTVTAVFVAASVFTPPINLGTTFYGLIHPDSGTASSYETEGLLTATVSTAGVLSGNVMISGTSVGFNGTVLGDGSTIFKTSSGTYTNTLAVGSRAMTLNCNLSSGNDQVTASLTGGGLPCSGTARRTYYNATRKVPTVLLNVGGTSGTLTMALLAKAQSPAVSTSLYPQGDGIATVTLTSAGGVTISGTLADGTAFSGSSAFVSAASCPYYVQLTVGGAKTGVLSGDLLFDTAQAGSDVSCVDMLWIRPLTTQTLYTNGWPAGIKVDALGALYTASATPQTSLALGSVNATNGNGKLVFTDGRLTSSITKTAFNVSGSTVTLLSAADKSFTLSFTTGGTFTGTFLPNWTPLATAYPVFKGIILQKGPNKGGYGWFISNKAGDTDPESGSVTLNRQ